MSRQGSLREQMPTVAGWVDDLRAVFGSDVIDSSIRFGMRGNAGFFHALEGEHSIGTVFNDGNAVSVADMVILVGEKKCETKDVRRSKKSL